MKIRQEENIKADAIAARQIHVLRQYQGSCERPIKLHDVKEMLREWAREHASLFV